MKVSTLKQLFLTAVAVFGFGACAQAQTPNTAQPEFKRNEFSTSANTFYVYNSNSYIGSVIFIGFNYKYNYYVSPKVALGVKHTFFWYIDFMLGVKYKYYDEKKISMSASSYHGIFSGWDWDEAIFYSEVNPFEVQFKLSENHCLFMNIGTKYDYSKEIDFWGNVELGYSFKF